METLRHLLENKSFNKTRVVILLLFCCFMFSLSAQPISDFKQIQQLRTAYLAPESVNLNRARTLAQTDFEKGGKYYVPFTWQNYVKNEQPTNTSSNRLTSVLPNISLYNTPTGRKIAASLAKNPNGGTHLDADIKQMLLEAGKIHELKRTHLTGLKIGNFDFLFDGEKIEILCKLKFQYPKESNAEMQTFYRNNFFEAIATYWTENGFYLEQKIAGKTQLIPIYFYIKEAEKGERFHKKLKFKTKIAFSANRSYVARNMNINTRASNIVLAHEFGHVLGLKDEYGYNFATMHGWNKFISKLTYNAPWRDNRFIEDKKALMNRNGKELRSRYFETFLKEMQRQYPTASWRIVEPTRLTNQ